LAQFTQAINKEIAAAPASHSNTARVPADAGRPGLNRVAFATRRTAVFAPSPMPRVATIMAVKPGLRAIVRNA
jgi:hypothetical protein